MRQELREGGWLLRMRLSGLLGARRCLQVALLSERVAVEVEEELGEN